MKRLKDSSVAFKVALAPLIAILCLLVVGAIGLWTSLELASSLAAIERRTLPTLTEINTFQNRLNGAIAKTYQSLAWTGAEFPADRVDALDKSTLTELRGLDNSLRDQLQRPDLNADSRRRLTAIQKSYQKFQRAAMDSLDIKSTVLAQATAFMQSVDESYGELGAQTRDFAEEIRRGAALEIQESATNARQRNWAILAAMLAALGVSATAVFWSVRMILTPLREAERLAGEVSNGDLTGSLVVDANDETGRVLGALGQVTHNLSHMVKDVRETALEMNAASDDIAGGTADLSARTENNAAALQEAAASMEQLTATIRSSAESAAVANGMARDASRAAQKGGALVLDAVSVMESVNGQAKTIAEITTTIDGIAFQTNILALNAAVEAARAGENGRGFAVVAGEVRSLAQRSAEAARQIRELIKNSVEQIGTGTGRVRTAGTAMAHIVESVGKLSATVDEISQAAKESAEGVAQVNQTISEMDRSTQQNAALVEQATAATESLRQRAGQLVASIQRFKTAA